MAVVIEKESRNEYSIYADGYTIGSFYPSEGIVLESSEGSPIPLKTLKQAITAMENIILTRKP